MKKLYLIFIFFVLCCISIFGDNDKLEEVDFLLFMPNSGNQLENEKQASIQLDNLAQYLSNKNLIPGQIIVYGYAAYAPNGIKSVDLSRERALFVMNELQKRGISKDLFSDPVGYGEVYLWGSNADENTRKLNRRVRILLDGGSPIPVTPEIVPEVTPKKTSFKFPWLTLPVLAVLAAVIIFLLKNRPRKTVHEDKPADGQQQITETDNLLEPANEAAVTTWTVNLDEEIRLRAYELSQQRNGTEDYREQDWYNAVHEISAWYTACGHSVFIDDGRWWASRSSALN